MSSGPPPQYSILPLPSPTRQINENDVCLTLTSGGCNSLHLCLAGARAVYSVDCNPAQSALLELKQVAIRQLGYSDVWALFGEGKVRVCAGLGAGCRGWDVGGQAREGFRVPAQSGAQCSLSNCLPCCPALPPPARCCSTRAPPRCLSATSRPTCPSRRCASGAPACTTSRTGCTTTAAWCACGGAAAAAAWRPAAGSFSGSGLATHSHLSGGAWGIHR